MVSFTASNFLDSLSSSIFGEKDFGDFGEKLGVLGSGISNFVKNLEGFDTSNLDVIKVACEGIKSLTDAAKDMPASGGVWQKLVGEIDIQTFGEKLPKLAEGLVNFVNTLSEGGFTSDKTNLVETACNAIGKFAEVAKSIPAEGGIWQKITGTQDLEAFATKFPQIGQGIAGFVQKLSEGGFDDNKIGIVDAAVNVMQAISSLGNIDISNVSNNLEKLGSSLVTFATKIAEYVNGIKSLSINDLESSKEILNKIIEIINTISEVNGESVESLGGKLKTFATDSLKSFIDCLNESQPKEDAKEAIKSIIDAIIKGMDDKKIDIENSSKAIIETAITALKTSDISGAEEAGKNFVQGFANGINNNIYLATDAGSAVGKQALEAAKNSIDSHSPSKETYKLGTFFDEGFINGVKSLQNKIYNETYGIGDKARLGLGRAIKGVSNLISEGIEDEITIRPILDLSNIRTGVNSINGMFGIPSIGVSTNLNAISTGMRNNNQNSGDEVVSAIDRLNKNLGNTSGDTYNINGITYDNGSEISEAVQTLIRAARIERRA